MKEGFIQACNGLFTLNGGKITLRGLSVGSWMIIENFMLRIPGTDRTIRQAYSDAYGADNAERFFDDFLYSFINEDDFMLLKSLGINVLRLPFSHGHFIDEQRQGVYKMRGFKHLDRVVDLCRKYGIYAILDMHSSPGGQNPDSHGGGETGTSEFWGNASLRESIVNLWGLIAERYKDNPVIAGYDILNEPCYVYDKDAFNDFYDKTIEKIREADQDHIVFLEGDEWARDFSIFAHMGEPQQAISFHFYPGQHVFLSTEREERRRQLETKLAYYTELRDKTGMPLWVGETGGHFPPEKTDQGMELVRDCLDLFEKLGISWTIWTYKDAGAMGIVYPDDTTKWSGMTGKFRRVWQTKNRSNPTVSAEILQFLESKFNYIIEEDLKERLKFRIFALLNELHTQKLLLPELRSIPWDEMKGYPKSFLLENCEGREEIADLIKSYTKES